MEQNGTLTYRWHQRLEQEKQRTLRVMTCLVNAVKSFFLTVSLVVPGVLAVAESEVDGTKHEPARPQFEIAPHILMRKGLKKLTIRARRKSLSPGLLTQYDQITQVCTHLSMQIL